MRPSGEFHARQIRTIVHTLETGPVVALAGRRIDPPGAPARFPPKAESAVARRIRDLLEELGPSALVASAACGADIIALEVAAGLGIRRRIILPFDRARFRITSVTDRPGNWGARYDAILAGLTGKDIVELGLKGGNVYARAGKAILDHATRLAGTAGVVAVIVWDGRSRGPGDVTAQFAADAASRGLDVREIDTKADTGGL